MQEGFPKPPIEGEADQSKKARYDLSGEELSVIEEKLVRSADAALDEPGLGIAWLEPDHPYANLARTYEARFFPEVAEIDEEDEAGTMFAVLVDNRESARRVVHGMTIMKPHSEPQPGDQPTGMYTVDSLIERGNFTPEEFYKHYADGQDIDMTKSISVETTFLVGERSEPLHGLRPAEISYLALFQMIENAGAQLGKAGVFLTVNGRGRSSLDRVGVNYEPLMGREDFDTEESELGIDSRPIAIKFDEKSAAIFGNASLKIPQIPV